jgi:hypothetical protein
MESSFNWILTEEVASLITRGWARLPGICMEKLEDKSGLYLTTND